MGEFDRIKLGGVISALESQRNAALLEAAKLAGENAVLVERLMQAYLQIEKLQQRDEENGSKTT